MTEVEALIEAVKEGDVTRVKALIGEAPALASARLPSGESPVMAALYRGHYHVIAALVDAGAEVDVFVAAATGRTGDLRRVLNDRAAVNAWADDGWTPLNLAGVFGRGDGARRLLDAGADAAAVSRISLTDTPRRATAPA